LAAFFGAHSPAAIFNDAAGAAESVPPRAAGRVSAGVAPTKLSTIATTVTDGKSMGGRATEKAD